MSAVLESASRFPGLPQPSPDAVEAFKAERKEAMDVVVASLGGQVSDLVLMALETAYSFGRLHAIQYARRVR